MQKILKKIKHYTGIIIIALTIIAITEKCITLIHIKNNGNTLKSNQNGK